MLTKLGFLGCLCWTQNQKVRRPGVLNTKVSGDCITLKDAARKNMQSSRAIMMQFGPDSATYVANERPGQIVAREAPNLPGPPSQKAYSAWNLGALKTG